MKNLLFISCFIIGSFVHSYGQVNCDDYRIISIFDIPPTPQTPGGNYFLLLLTLDADNPGNTDNYANLFFVDNLGDTISIPTGSNSTLPVNASDTIPYILQLASTDANQDFPEEFDGELVIIHGNQFICEVDYSNGPTQTNDAQVESAINIFPNPFADFVKVDSDKFMDRIIVLSSDGRAVDEFHPKSSSYSMNLKHLRIGQYFIVIQFKGGRIELRRIMKI